MATSNDTLTESLMTLITQLGPVGRRKVMREIAQYLKKANRQRIQHHQQPDGSEMQKRKDKSQGKMFKKLKARLRYKAHSQGLEVGFFGRNGYVASNHHFGKELQRKSRDGNSYSIDLPARELLGLSANDKQEVQNILLEHLGTAA